jgi:hypothetical protein
MLEHHPVADAAAVTAERVRRVERRPLPSGQRAELDPDRLQQA